MNEKTRLKNSKEILSSLGVSLEAKEGEDAVVSRKRKNAPPQPVQAKPPAREEQDPAPLDFSRYASPSQMKQEAEKKQEPIQEEPWWTPQTVERTKGEAVGKPEEPVGEEPVVAEDFQFEDFERPAVSALEKGQTEVSALLEDPVMLEGFMKALEQQFEKKFSQRFEGESTADEQQSKLRTQAKLYALEQALREEEQMPEEQREEVDLGDFFESFSREAKEDQAVQKQSFQEELGEKFRRERERYLREFQREEGARQPKGERKLNYQIQPEMHRQEEGAGVLYSRQGKVRPLDAPTKKAAGSRKKGKERSGEELLMELAAGGGKPQRKAPRPMRAGTDTGMGQGAYTGRIVLISAVACIVVLASALAGLAFWKPVAGQAAEESYPVSEAEIGETLHVYENRLFQPRGEYENVLVKKSGISLENLTVNGLLVIEDIPGAGGVTLQNVEVNGAIMLRTSGINSLVLRDVQAEQVVVANNLATVDVSLEGNTRIAAMEARSPVTLNGLALGTQAEGLKELSLRGEGPMSLLATGLAIDRLDSVGGVTMELEDSRIEFLSVEGSITASGSGKVGSLAAGAYGEDPLIVMLKGVGASSISLKSPAHLSLSGHADHVYTADDLNLAGNGTIANLIINEKPGGGRLKVELAGVTVQTLTAQADTRVDSVGSSLVNTLIANRSVYQMGNKVNLLTVNTDGVIYEREPDKILTAEGVRPPQTVADNPNIDYTLTQPGAEAATDVSAELLATTCGHTREDGGFVVGDGSADHPYLVGTPAQLAHVALHLSSHYEQKGDIDLADDSRFASGFSPLAAQGTPFSGSYNGAGYVIKNLRINDSGDKVGLFAENAGALRFVHVQSGEVTATGTGNVFAGGLVGLNYQSGSITCCASGVSVNAASGAYLGGLAGYNYGGKVQNSYNYAKITGGGNTGGLVGVNRESGILASCYSVGQIAGEGSQGGVAGYNEGATVTNCHFLLGTAEEGIGAGNGGVFQVDDETLRGQQILIDLGVGAPDSPWQRGSGTYAYPVLELPPTT